MRSVSTAVKTLLANDPSPAFLVEIVATNTTLRYTNAPIDLIIPSIGTFVANNTLDKVEAPRLSESLDREPYKITFFDANGYFRSLFETGLTGAKITVWVVFLNNTDSTLSGVLPGNYLTSVDDLLIAYGGTVDTHGITVEPANGMISAVIEGSSPVAALGMTRAITTSKEYVKQINPADTSFDQVFEDGAKLPWGKIS